MAKQCDFCFQFKDPLLSILPKANVRVCKACNYKVQAVIGFLNYHRMTLEYKPGLEPSPSATQSEEALKAGAPKRRGKGSPTTPKHS